jgi:predicted transposase YdaD
LLIWRDELLSWRKFQIELNSYSEADLLALLDEERTQHRRVSMLERIHQRYCTLRANRERMEIMKEGKRP